MKQETDSNSNYTLWMIGVYKKNRLIIRPEWDLSSWMKPNMVKLSSIIEKDETMRSQVIG